MPNGPVFLRNKGASPPHFLSSQSWYRYVFRSCKNSMTRKRITGNTMAVRMPFCMERPEPVTKPTRAGPVEQPTSPARANMAYI